MQQAKMRIATKWEMIGEDEVLCRTCAHLQKRLLSYIQKEEIIPCKLCRTLIIDQDTGKVLTSRPSLKPDVKGD